MKKTLLTMAAISMVAGAWAQTKPIDVTPTYYKFYKDTEENLASILRSDVRQPVAFNLGGNNWITNNSNGNGEDYFTADQLANGNILFGAFVFNQSKEAEFAKAFSLYDFGGELGQVLILNGQNSTLNEKVQTALSLETAPEIPAYNGAFGANFQYNHILDFNEMNKYVLAANPSFTEDDLLEQAEYNSINPIRIRMRVVLNAYNNDMSKELNQLNTMYIQNEAGNVVGIESTGDGYIDVTQFSKDNVWDPTTWMVREWDLNYTGIASYLKFIGTVGESDFDNGALLVRSIEVCILPESAETYPNLEGKNYSAFHDELVTYTIGGGTTGINSISQKVEGPVEYYNLQGVKIANPENGVFIRKQGNTTSKVIIR